MAVLWQETPWLPSTAYAAGARVLSSGAVYVCRTSGTSWPAQGPSAVGSGIVDGSVTWDYLGAYLGYFALAFAPELATGSPAVTPAMQALYLTLAESLVSDARIWLTPDLLDAGRGTLAAHYGQLARLRGHGPVTTEAVGALSRGYAALTGKFAVDFTSAGRAYMDLVRTTPSVFGLQA